MGGRSGHGGPNAARAMDGNGVLRGRARAAKIPEGFSNESPKKLVWPLPKLPAKIQSNLFKIKIVAE